MDDEGQWHSSYQRLKLKSQTLHFFADYDWNVVRRFIYLLIIIGTLLGIWGTIAHKEVRLKITETMYMGSNLDD